MKEVVSILFFSVLHSLVIAQINFPQEPKESPYTPLNLNSSKVNTYTPKSKNDANEGMHRFEKQRNQREELRQILNEEKKQLNINYELPGCASPKGRELYKQAFTKLNQIISSDSLSLKDAVYTVESSYYDDNVNYEKYNAFLNECIAVCKQKLLRDGYKEDNPLAKILVLYKFFSDTVRYKDVKTHEWKKHYPFAYDFEDWEGKEDYSKMFVTKLMTTHSGQCHSLPLLFLILAQEWGVSAYMSYSPNHSFVKFKDAEGKMINIELTNGKLTTDQWVTGSGYVKAEALRSKIYLDTVPTKQVIAQCFVDLAQGYAARFCYDKFVLQCSDEAIKYYPNNIFAQQLKSDYYTLQFDYVIKQLGEPPIKDLPKYPLANEIFTKRNQLYDLVDNLGYEPMPSDAYQSWLHSVKEEKNNRESEQMQMNLKQSIKK